MPSKKPAEKFELSSALIAAHATNNRINIYLINGVPDEAWRAPQPGGKGRTIGAIAAHMHNVRLMWLKAVGVKELPDKLDTDAAAKADVIKALEQSCKALEGVISASLAADGKIKGFKPDVASFFAYLMAHDAHHRGQITMLARQVGNPVSQSTMFGLWEWGTR